MDNDMMNAVMAMPRNRWLLLSNGMARSVAAALGAKYTNHTLLDTPQGQLRVLRMGRVRLSNRGGSSDVWAFCDRQQAPANPAWDSIGRLTVDKATRLVEVEAAPTQAPLLSSSREASAQAAADLAQLEDVNRRLLAQNVELFAKAGGLEAERDALVATVRELKNAPKLEGARADLQDDVDVALDLLRVVARMVDGWDSTAGRVVASVVGSAIKALEGKA